MFDYHYDLLTNVYLHRNNLSKLREYYKKIYNKNNITGGIFNLFFMNEIEMKEELGIEKHELNLKNMLYVTHKLIKQYEMIPRGIKCVYGIEGLDYLKKLEDVEYIYKLGVRSVNIVWNNENKFGGGIKANSNIGLTEMGKELIEKLVECGITIDLSHANEKTFFDITDYCKYLIKNEREVRIIASHSNAKAICNVPRNLTDEQLLTIKELGGIVGVVGIKKFCKEGPIEGVTKEDYLKHIEYITELFGGTEQIGIASDDMSYYPTDKEYYENANVIKFENIGEELANIKSKPPYWMFK